jgi:hypothetical protein
MAFPVEATPRIRRTSRAVKASFILTKFPAVAKKELGQEFAAIPNKNAAPFFPRIGCGNL